jgi:hypothetical protein
VSEAGAAPLGGIRVLDLSRLLPGLTLARTPSELGPPTSSPRAGILPGSMPHLLVPLETITRKSGESVAPNAIDGMVS